MKNGVRSSQTLFLTLILFVLGLGACGKKSGFEETTVSRRTARGASAILQNIGSSSIPLDPSTNKVWGEVLEIGFDSTLFAAEAVRFMGATTPPNEVGVVSGRSGDITGIRFWGNVDLQSGPLTSSNLSSTSVVANTAQLRLTVWDSLAGTEDSNGNTIPEYAVSFAQAVSGSVAGNTATVTFEDTFGRVTLSGTFDQNFYRGTVTYQNFTSYSSSVLPANGVLGNFSIRTCGFFNCQ